MNIFVLDRDPGVCAAYHTDVHVPKMILESAQMLCTVLHGAGIDAPYLPTHRSHPCTLWTGRSLSNWRWLASLALHLDREYRSRFGADREHASAGVVRGLPEPPLPDPGPTPFAQAMPEAYRGPDPVLAYRRYYAAEKATARSWARGSVPEWFVRMRGEAEG